MRHAKKIIIAVAVLAAAALGGAALAGATSGGDDERALTGSTLDRASQAALAETGGGKVTGSERDSEDGATYEVEVTKDGRQVDVRLDDRFKVLKVEGDHEDRGDGADHED